MPTLEDNISNIEEAEELVKSGDFESILKAKRIASEEYQNLSEKKYIFTGATQSIKKIYRERNAEMGRLNIIALFHLLFLFFFILGIWISAASSDWGVFVFFYLFFAAPCESVVGYLRYHDLGEMFVGYLMGPLAFLDIFSYPGEKSKINEKYDYKIYKKIEEAKTNPVRPDSPEEKERKRRIRERLKERKRSPEWKLLTEEEQLRIIGRASLGLEEED